LLISGLKFGIKCVH